MVKRKANATTRRPGQGPLPGAGRKKLPPELKEAFAMMSRRGQEIAEKLLEDAKTPLAVKVKIWEIALDRHLGKPPQAVTVDGGGQINLIFPVNLDGI